MDEDFDLTAAGAPPADWDDPLPPRRRPPAGGNGDLSRRPDPRRGRRRWRRFLLVYALCFLLLGGAGCFLLYRYMGAFEISRPEHVMDALMAETSPDQWFTHAHGTLELDVSEFEDPDTLFAEYFNAYLRDVRYSYYRDASAYSDDAPVYTVRAGTADLCSVRLTPRGSHAAGFGFELWDVGEISSCFHMGALESVTVEVLAPRDQTVRINGMELGERYIVDDQAPCPDMIALERRFDRQPSFVQYQVDAMYGSIVVTDGEGNELAPEPDSPQGFVTYLLPETDLYAFTVRAPEDVTVEVCGAVLTEADASAVDAGILEGLEAYTGEGAYATRTYSFSGLYSVPEITAADAHGTALTPLVTGEAGQMTFYHAQDEALCAQAEPRVQEFFEKYVRYSAHAYEEANYYQLLACILPGTELYDYVKDSTAAMIWASATEVAYDELTFTDFSPVSEQCFTCTIRYKADFAATAWYESYNYELENAYELAFVKVEDEWYAAAMSIVTAG